MGFLTSLALGLGVPQRFAKLAGILGAILLLVALLGVGKCVYDRSIIKNHTAKQDAANSKADRKADTRAAETRRGDDARLAQETEQLKRAQANAQTDLDRRLARHRCLRLQQQSRAANREPPACH